MIDTIFCFFFCAKVITHQVTYQQPYAAKTEEIQQEEDDPLSTNPRMGERYRLGNSTTDQNNQKRGENKLADQRNADQGGQRQQQNTTQIDGTNAKQEQKGVWKAGKSIRGYVSHYSAKWGACLGCSPHYDSKGQLYYVTASGDRLDDNRLTIACTDDFALGSTLSITNLDNLKSVAVVCNDRGGFNTPKYNNRIADLTPAVQKALGTVTDKTLVEITEVPKVAEK